MRKLRHEEIPRPSADELDRLPRHPIVVLVDNVRSLYNVGSIFRTSDAARIERILLTGISGTPDHRGMHKTALGAQDTVPWSYEPNAGDVVQHLREEGYAIAVLEITDASSPVEHLTLDAFPLCLIVGNEITGVDDALVAQADLAIEIPQFGAKQSLNVAVAYGVAVFDLVRHYRSLTGAASPEPYRP